MFENWEYYGIHAYHRPLTVFVGHDDDCLLLLCSELLPVKVMILLAVPRDWRQSVRPKAITVYEALGGPITPLKDFLDTKLSNGKKMGS